jgi:hypothetical protein
MHRADDLWTLCGVVGTKATDDDVIDAAEMTDARKRMIEVCDGYKEWIKTKPR